MGLDMYAMTTTEEFDSEVDFEVSIEKQFHRWLKHWNLHQWMTDLYSEKGGSANSFNLVNLELTFDDLQTLDSVIRTGRLRATNGFLYGEYDSKQTDEDHFFIKQSRKAIASGLYVFYRAWW